MSDLDKIFKAYDVRGVVPDELDESVAEAVGAAVHCAALTGVRGVDEHILHGAVQRLHFRLADFVLQCYHAGEALLLHLTRHVVFHLRGHGAGPRRIFKGEELHEAHLAQAVQRALEVLLRLAREAHDQVRTQLHARRDSLQIPHLRDVLVQRVVTAHFLEQAVGTRLERQV